MIKKVIALLCVLFFSITTFAEVFEGTLILTNSGGICLVDDEGITFAVLPPVSNTYVSNKLSPFLNKRVRVISTNVKLINCGDIKYMLLGDITAKEIADVE